MVSEERNGDEGHMCTLDFTVGLYKRGKQRPVILIDSFASYRKISKN